MPISSLWITDKIAGDRFRFQAQPGLNTKRMAVDSGCADSGRAKLVQQGLALCALGLLGAALAGCGKGFGRQGAGRRARWSASGCDRGDVGFRARYFGDRAARPHVAPSHRGYPAASQRRDPETHVYGGWSRQGRPATLPDRSGPVRSGSPERHRLAGSCQSRLRFRQSAGRSLSGPQKYQCDQQVRFRHRHVEPGAGAGRR